MIQKNISREEFAKGRIEIPGPLKGDAYTVAGEALADQKSREKSVYGVMFRRSPDEAPEFEGLAKDGRMVSFGLVDYIRNNLTKPITREKVNEAEQFMQTAHAFGGPLNFDRKPWDRVVDEFGGYLPLKIQALPEGSTFYKNEVPVQVESLDKGFGEISALIEADMLGMVSVGSARATMERHMLERFLDYAKEDMPKASPEDQLFAAKLMAHEFSKRAYSTPEQSEFLGKAHLLSFPGTDTFDAAYAAYKENGDQAVGSSIAALAHRVVMGSESEQACFDNLRKVAGPGGIGSYLADTYNFKKAVSDKLVPMALDAQRTDGGILVARPDSGNYLENTMYILNQAKENGLFDEQENGRLAMNNLRYIQGDSMNWEKIKKTMDTQIEQGFSPVNSGIFGIGGWLAKTPTRDTLSVAYKLMAKGEDLESTVKLADTLAKMSVPGPVQVLRGQNADQPSTIMHYETPTSGKNALVTFYDASKDGIDKFSDSCLETFSVRSNRVVYDFMEAPLEQRILSDGIIEIQNSVMKQHGRSLGDYQY
jgi:nicotinamide phosphoribosyltransferase